MQHPKYNNKPKMVTTPSQIEINNKVLTNWVEVTCKEKERLESKMTSGYLESKGGMLRCISFINSINLQNLLFFRDMCNQKVRLVITKNIFLNHGRQMTMENDGIRRIYQRWHKVMRDMGVSSLRL